MVWCGNDKFAGMALYHDSRRLGRMSCTNRLGGVVGEYGVSFIILFSHLRVVFAIHFTFI